MGRQEAILHEPAAPVDQVDLQVRTSLDEMAQFMQKHGGCGLAAPQVGLDQRMVVVDAGHGLVEMVNPTIVERKGGTFSLEGCMSLPNSMSLVWRSREVTVAGLDQEGQPVERPCTGLESRCFQHEIDHLDGKLMTDQALVTVTPLRALLGAGGALAGGILRGAAGAAVGGSVGLALAWGAEHLRGDKSGA